MDIFTSSEIIVSIHQCIDFDYRMIHTVQAEAKAFLGPILIKHHAIDSIHKMGLPSNRILFGWKQNPI